jgi:hypothetical protein
VRNTNINLAGIGVVLLGLQASGASRRRQRRLLTCGVA